jgi:hypothetical protein
MRGEEVCEPGDGRASVGWLRHTRGMHGEALTQGLWGPRVRAERTKNMKFMSVTLEVSQPEMSALKFLN